jgi:hypothetical protein
MTSIEWLFDNLKSHFEHDGDLLEVVKMSFDQAEKMHKEEIIDAWKMGRYDSDEIVMTETFYAEKYYNQTFKPCQ